MQISAINSTDQYNISKQNTKQKKNDTFSPAFGMAVNQSKSKYRLTGHFERKVI